MIYAGGGDVIKFAGDALLVVWRENKKPVAETVEAHQTVCIKQSKNRW